MLVLSYVALLTVAGLLRLPGLLLGLASLPVAARTWGGLSRPQPPQTRGRYPLWFTGYAFTHMRRFGLLLLLGLAIQVAVEALLKAL